MAKKKSKSKSKVSVSFEKSLSDLEQVVGALEQGQLSLDESLEKYEAGMKHLRNCYAALQKAEQQIHLLVDVDDSGNAKVKEFNHQATHDERSIDSDGDEESSDDDPHEGTLF